MQIPVTLAFLAGLASFLSPCVFPLVPAYIGYLSGRAAAGGISEKAIGKWETFAHGFAFVLGFSAVFILLGITISAVSGLLNEFRYWLAKIGGVVVVFFGLHMTGLVRIPWLEYDLRPKTSVERKRSFFSSFMLGVVFSAGWSPCVGPVLGSILTLVLNGGSIAQGAMLLASYSAGLAVPFLLAALGTGWILLILKKHRTLMHVIEIITGAVLIIVGIMLFFDVFALLSQFGTLFDFGL
jgi:cytochrome c-type biogenesis protein